MTDLELREPVLVTGATGFIGSHLVSRLMVEGRSVRALVLPGEEVPDTWADQVDVRRGDIADRAAVEAALDGAGTVIHLAAVVQDWGRASEHQRVTVQGTENVLGRAAADNVRAVLASSIVVYGQRIHDGVCDEGSPHGKPLGPYSRSKQAQEILARKLEANAGLKLTIVRPANVFGPGCIPWVHEAIRELRRGNPALIDGGDKNAGLCHVRNLVDVLIRAASLESAVGRTYNAADGSDVTWKRYFSDLARLAATAPPRSAPRALLLPLAHLLETVWKLGAFARRPPVTREALNLVGSHHRIPIDRARSELGYVPSVEYREAIDELARSLA